MKKWFLNRYPEFATFGMTEEQIQEYEASKAKLAAAMAAAAAAKSNVTEFPAAPASELGKTGTD